MFCQLSPTERRSPQSSHTMEDFKVPFPSGEMDLGIGVLIKPENLFF